MKRTITVEVCAASVTDCIKAEQAGADRIELNSALYLGGLTPSLGTLHEAVKRTNLPIITMVRSRPGGFHYSILEKQAMMKDALYLIEEGSNGIVFGFLNEDNSVDQETTQEFVKICHDHLVEAIFHRAFDQTPDPNAAVETLIECGVDRILTSGQRRSAHQGVSCLRSLQERYGNSIEICAGAGINEKNVRALVKETGVNQVHGSFKTWYEDPTTRGTEVSYAYSNDGDFEGVSVEKIKKLIKALE